MARRGVNIYGYVYAESGVGELTRLLAAAVKEAGLDYTVVPFTSTQSRQQCRFDDRGLGEPVFDLNIVGVNADSFPDFVQHFGTGVLTDHYTVGLWAWEIEHFPTWMANSAHLVDEVWAISSFTAQAIQQQICKPVLPFPLPIKTPQPPALSRADLGLPEGFLFLFCFDFDSIFQRKNPEAVIAAFTKAFPPGEGPDLFIKSVNGERQPELLARLTAAAGERSDIHLVDSYWQENEVEALMGLCDAYVSLHRSEGFGLTMAEAMALGKPVIATAYSGNLDFMTENNSYPVPYTPVKIGRGAEPYPEHVTWAEPDVAAAAAAMRRVWQHPEEVLIKTAQARQDIERLHGPRARAVFVRDRLAVIFDEIDRRRSAPPLSSPPAAAPGPPAPQPESGALETVRRRLVQGPDAGMPSRLGRLAVVLRRSVLRLLQNYTVYQRGVDEAMVEAISSLEQRLQGLQQGLAPPSSSEQQEVIDPRIHRELLRVHERLQIMINRDTGQAVAADQAQLLPELGELHARLGYVLELLRQERNR